jgi:hypothetical protein
MNKTTINIHKQYVKDGGTLDYTTFKKIISEFNTAVMDEILAGKEFDMGCNLSKLSIVRIGRNFNKPRINWLESFKLKDQLEKEGVEVYSRDNPEGEKWFVYYTDPFYFRFYWNKQSAKLKNKTVYRFDPTRGALGNKGKLVNLLRDNEFAYLNFRLIQE